MTYGPSPSTLAIEERVQELVGAVELLAAAERRGDPSPGLAEQLIDELHWLAEVAAPVAEGMRAEAIDAIECWKTYAESLERSHAR